MSSEAQNRASIKFNRDKTTCVMVRLNLSTDKDIISKLETVPSKMGYIKELIRKDIQKNGS